MNKTILLVDDEEYLRETLRFGLEYEDYKVVEAGTGNEALKVCQTQSIDLILTDMRMPDGDGHELIKLMKAQAEPVRSIPIIVMTGYTEIARDELIKAGASEVVMKPFALAGLIQVISKILIS